eukprot:COSAG04_NODE_20430_length_394_cov_0.613559_1_plen_81_part_00
MRLRRKTQREGLHLLAEEDAEGGDAEGDEEGLPLLHGVEEAALLRADRLRVCDQGPVSAAQQGAHWARGGGGVEGAQMAV